MPKKRRMTAAAFIGLGVGLGLALYLNPALRKKANELLSEQLGGLWKNISETWDEYPQRIAFAIAAGREAACIKQGELEQVLAGTPGGSGVEEPPKHII